MESNLYLRKVLSFIDLGCGAALQAVMDRPDADRQIKQIAK